MLDRYAEPPRDAATLAARREALLDQLGWLEDEATALAPLLGALPAWATDQAPMPDDLSGKQMFAGLAALDRETYPGWIAAVREQDTPEFAAPALEADPSANARELNDLLADLRVARADLRATFEAVPAEAWARRATLDGTATDLYGLALAVVQHDAEVLKTLAYRMHEADLRPPTPGSDLPQPPQA